MIYKINEWREDQKIAKTLLIDVKSVLDHFFCTEIAQK